ncbi:hypothetical protein ADK43_17265, partial [Streptomyces rimosus subsp. rimosus]
QNTAETGPDDLIDVTQLLDDPHAGYAVLREAGPRHRIAGPEGQPAGLGTRDEGVGGGVSEPRAFPGKPGTISAPPADPHTATPATRPAGPARRSDGRAPPPAT